MDNITPFSIIFDSFFGKITDDMYVELTQDDTYKMVEELLYTAMHKFEFPHFDITDFEKSSEIIDEDTKEITYQEGHFNSLLTNEEINILSTYMVVEWLGQQLASIENTRMKYSGNDFKFTSQANHMSKILTLKKDYEREGFHLQRLYCRREKNEEGIMHSTFGSIMQKSPEGREVQTIWK